MFLRSMFSVAILATLPLAVMADSADYAIFAISSSGATSVSETGAVAAGNASVVNSNHSYAYGSANTDTSPVATDANSAAISGTDGYIYTSVGNGPNDYASGYNYGLGAAYAEAFSGIAVWNF